MNKNSNFKQVNIEFFYSKDLIQICYQLYIKTGHNKIFKSAIHGHLWTIFTLAIKIWSNFKDSDVFSLLQQSDELFFSQLSSSAPYGVIYQNDNANTNRAVDSLYCYDSHEVLSSNDQPFEYNNNYQSNSFSNDIYPTNDNTYSIGYWGRERFAATWTVDLWHCLAGVGLNVHQYQQQDKRLEITYHFNK